MLRIMHMLHILHHLPEGPSQVNPRPSSPAVSPGDSQTLRASRQSGWLSVLSPWLACLRLKASQLASVGVVGRFAYDEIGKRADLHSSPPNRSFTSFCVCCSPLTWRVLFVASQLRQGGCGRSWNLQRGQKQRA